MNTTSWTPEGEDNLRELVRAGMSGGIIAETMGRTRSAVIAKAYRLGLSLKGASVKLRTEAPAIRSRKEWTWRETTTLRRLIAEGKSAMGISEEMGRTEQSVRCRMSVLGLSCRAARKMKGAAR